MKISNLSRKSGVPVATIKFYLRDGLLRPGQPTARNQADYDDSHLERLRLIRVLTGMGMMSLASVREVLSAIDSNCLSPHGLAKAVNRAMLAEHPVSESDPSAFNTALAHVNGFVNRLGWQVDGDAPGRQTLAQVVAALISLGISPDVNTLAPYADAAERLAAAEFESMSAASASVVVARTVLFEVAFAVMRRMAYEHYMAMLASGQAAAPAIPRQRAAR